MNPCLFSLPLIECRFFPMNMCYLEVVLHIAYARIGHIHIDAVFRAEKEFRFRFFEY